MIPGKRIGFLGCGNMGQGILSGILTRGVAKRKDIFVYDVLPGKIREIERRFGVREAGDIPSLVRNVSTLILAFKPQDLAEAARSIRQALSPRQLIITILAGVPISRIRKELGAKVAVVRAMPNLCATIGEAVTALAGSRSSHLRVAEEIFSGSGLVLRLPERHFDTVTALSGSGPAYFFYLIELLLREGRRHGLPGEAADILARQTAKGACLLASRSKEPVSWLRRRVTSKGGTTEAALRTLEKKGWPSIFQHAMDHAIQRAKILGRR